MCRCVSYSKYIVTYRRRLLILRWSHSILVDSIHYGLPCFDYFVSNPQFPESRKNSVYVFRFWTFFWHIYFEFWLTVKSVGTVWNIRWSSSCNFLHLNAKTHGDKLGYVSRGHQAKMCSCWLKAHHEISVLMASAKIDNGNELEYVSIKFSPLRILVQIHPFLLNIINEKTSHYLNFFYPECNWYIYHVSNTKVVRRGTWS